MAVGTVKWFNAEQGYGPPGPVKHFLRACPFLTPLSSEGGVSL